MLLSVGIPVYNGERYIRESIQSVLDQTYTDFELIVTDDGSNDGTMEIVHSFADPRLRIVSDGSHKGLAIRLNEQITMARGEYFVRMDADDVMLPNRLQRQVEFFKKHPNADVVGSSAIVIDEHGTKIGWRGANKWKRGMNYTAMNLSSFESSSFMHPTVMGKISWFRKYYYNPTCEGCEDLELWARSVNESNFFVLREPLLLYRDVQKIDLPTYLYRRRQERYALKLNKERFPLWKFLYYKDRSLFKSIVVGILTKIGAERFVLKARNNDDPPLNNRVLHIITTLHTGGAEKLMVDLLPKLATDAEVELLVFDGLKTPFYNQLKATGVKIHDFGEGSNVYNPLFIFRLIPLLRKFDVVHAHNTACQLFVAIANLFVGTRIVTTEHSTSNRRRNYRWLLPLDRWMYRQFEQIITVSDIAGQNIKDYVGNQSLPTKTIENGIDVKKYSEASSCVQIDTEYPSVFKAVMVAGFRYEKDQKTVIRAYSLLPEHYHLFLVGDGVERESIENLITSLDLSSRIHLLGIRMDVPNLLKSADVVIMSSHREGLSLSNLEGMASGKPFVASDVDGLHEIVSGYGILFPHEDAQVLADVIRKCCEDKEYADKVGKKCQEKAMQYDISLMAKHYLEVYQKTTI